MFDRYNSQLFENIEFEANLNILKKYPPNQFGCMVLYYEA